MNLQELDGRIGDQVIWNDNVGDARVVYAQGQNHWGRLRAVVNQFVAYADLHGGAPSDRRRSLEQTLAVQVIVGNVAYAEIPAQRPASALHNDSTITLRKAVQCRPALIICF